MIFYYLIISTVCGQSLQWKPLITEELSYEISSGITVEEQNDYHLVDGNLQVNVLIELPFSTFSPERVIKVNNSITYGLIKNSKKVIDLLFSSWSDTYK